MVKNLRGLDCYIISDGSLYIILPSKNSNVWTNADASYLFSNKNREDGRFKKLKTITNLTYLKTDNATNMQGFFMGCEVLSSFDMTKMVTSKVTDMSKMFMECKAITNLKGANSLDVTSVTTLKSFYSGCSNLTTIQKFKKSIKLLTLSPM